MAPIKAIEKKIAAILTSAAGGQVEVTSRDSGLWTISGQPAHVAAAVAYVTGNGIMALQDQAHDDELGEAFAYLADAA